MVPHRSVGGRGRALNAGSLQGCRSAGSLGGHSTHKLCKIQDPPPKKIINHLGI